MRILYSNTLLSILLTAWGFTEECKFTIENTSLLNSNNQDILTIYLEAFDQYNVHSTLDIFTVQVNHIGTNCENYPFTLKYTFQIFAPEIGLDGYEIFYIAETTLDTNLTYQFYSSSDFIRVPGITVLSEELISYISQSGKLPNGKYLFQFEIKNDIGFIIDRKSEFLEVDRPQILELISPGGSLSELTYSYTYSKVPLFTWYSDYCSQCTYGIRVCEYIQDKHSSLNNALNDWSLLPYDQSNKYHAIPWNTFSFQYPAWDHISLEVGKHYVWQIRRSYETTLEPHYDYSPINIFEVRSTTKQQLDFIDPYLLIIQSLISKEQFNLLFSAGGELERFITFGEAIWINGEELHIDALYSLLNELNQGKIKLDKIQIK